MHAVASAHFLERNALEVVDVDVLFVAVLESDVNLGRYRTVAIDPYSPVQVCPGLAVAHAALAFDVYGRIVDLDHLESVTIAHDRSWRHVVCRDDTFLESRLAHATATDAVARATQPFVRRDLAGLESIRGPDLRTLLESDGLHVFGCLPNPGIMRPLSDRSVAAFQIRSDYFRSLMRKSAPDGVDFERRKKSSAVEATLASVLFDCVGASTKAFRNFTGGSFAVICLE
jgi:hypothetical protein